jgi:hypothetical protein
MEHNFAVNVQSEFAAQPQTAEVTLQEADILHLPAPVRSYLVYTGALGRIIPQNMRIQFSAQMFRRPGGRAVQASSEQYNFFSNPARLFFMKASMFLIPFRVLHAYREQKAAMTVRVASLFNAVDLAGEELTLAETVTILNDMCLFAPGCLTDKRLQWQEISPFAAQVVFTNGPYTVSATLYFNEKGELVKFVSDDRGALQDDGTLKKVRWSTPVGDYREYDGRRIPTYGETIYHYPEGDFTYGMFTLRAIGYNSAEPVHV